MPGWSSRLIPNAGPSSSRRAPSPDSLYDGDFDLPEVPIPYAAPERRGSSGQRQQITHSSSPPRGPHNAPRSRPHMHTGSDRGADGSRKRRPPQNDFEPKSLPTSSDTFIHERTVAAAARPVKNKVDERDMDAGNCATCDAKVRWPRGVNEFRCGTCLMVNDLKAISSRSRAPRDHGQPQAAPGQQSSAQGVANAGKAPMAPLTVERTMNILNRCLDTYFEAYRLGHVPGSAALTRSPPGSPPADLGSPNKMSPASPGPRLALGDLMKDLPTTPPEDYMFPQPLSFDPSSSPNRSPQLRQDADGRSQMLSGATQIPRKPIASSASPVPARPVRKPPPAPVAVSEGHNGGTKPSRDTNDQSGGRTQPMLPPSRIFKPLEDYISRSYGDQECLSTSFLTPRSRPRVASHTEGSRPRTAGSPPKRPAGQFLTPPPGPGSKDASISEIDAKTLLLGDVAANGLWWTGMEERAPLGQRRKSDRGQEASRTLVSLKTPHINWFEADNWYDTILRAGINWRDRVKSDSHQGLDAQEVENHLSQGRAHLHQTLLKAAETLLKRPGRPLKEPQDVRFLLLVLANPMIHPSKPAAHSGVGSNAFEAGHAFGIIKRILGLLSNMSNDCHRHLVAWFSRYEEPRFRTIVDVVERFVTHRLKRSHGRKKSGHINPTVGLIPNLSGTSADTSASLHAALGLSGSSKNTTEKSTQSSFYSEDWQVRAAARIMSLLFTANKNFTGDRMASTLAEDARMSRPGSISRTHIKIRGQLLSTSDFYNSMVDMLDLVADFDTWESSKARFAFCQYPFFLSVGAKIRIMEHDAKRQMESRAREAFFDSLLKNKALEQHLILKVRRDCLVEDSLNGISEVVGTGQEDIKKRLKVQFAHEEGIDAGGLRKEWFMLLAREIFDPNYGLFLYDDESKFAWFNPNSFESSDRFFLVGALIGLAIYHTTIIDVPLPPFTFKKLLAASPPPAKGKALAQRPPLHYTLDDLAELRPSLARGLKQLLAYDGNVQETFCRDFVAEVSTYGANAEVPLCDGGQKRAVTNANRAEFVDLYIRFLLDTQVARQFEPFKRGFFTVCGGNALSLFQPEEIELLVRGSDEGLDVSSLRGVATYTNWKINERVIRSPDGEVPLVTWFWELLEEASPQDQRKLLSFITGSDRIPAIGAANLVITIQYAGPDPMRFPIARTCFNMIMLFGYRSKRQLAEKLWKAVTMSEGFGLR